MKGKKGKGLAVLSAVASALLTASFFIFAHYLLGSIQPATLLVFWFISAAVVSTAVVLYLQGFKGLLLVRKYWRQGAIIGGINAIAAFTVFYSIKLLGPSLSAFLLSFATPFAILLGFVLLRERLNRFEMLGMLIAIAGAIIIDYQGGNYLVLGSLVTLFAAFVIAVHHYASKRLLAGISPLTLAHLRIIFTALFALLPLLFGIGTFEIPGLQQLAIIALGSTLSAFISFFLFFYALNHLGVSKTSVIRTLDPFIVVLYSLIIFRTVPQPLQLAGGFLIVLGVGIMTWFENR